MEVETEETNAAHLRGNQPKGKLMLPTYGGTGEEMRDTNLGLWAAVTAYNWWALEDKIHT